MKNKFNLGIVRLASLLIVGATLSACGGGGSDGTTPVGQGQAPVAGGSPPPAAPESTLPAAPTAPAAPPASPAPPASSPPSPVAPVLPVSPKPPATAPATANRAPTITGQAPTAVVAGQFYSFVPAAADADGDALTFSISSKPVWAKFDPRTGRISGVPLNTQAGSYEEIEVSVTDGKATSKLPQFAIVVTAPAPTIRTVTLSWNPPTENEDGTALTNLRGYRILYGQKSGTYDSSVQLDNPGLARYVLENLSPGRYFFALVAVNSAGTESAQSSEVSVDLT